jgi:DNA invertase Pin-like site-specific DNA recombinase
MKKGVVFGFLDQPELNSEGKYIDFLLTVLAAVAQLERDILDEKRREGIAARAKGVRVGRPRLVSPKLQTEAMALKESGIAQDRAPAKPGRVDDLPIAGRAKGAREHLTWRRSGALAGGQCPPK